MGVLKEKLNKKEVERRSGVLEEMPESEVEKEEPIEKLKEELSFDFLRKKHNEESVMIAEELSRDIEKVLLGGSLTYFFDEDSVGVPGLSFSFKTLSSFEDSEFSLLVKSNSWEAGNSRFSFDLVVYEEIICSLISYCGFDLNGVSSSKKREKIEKVPAFIMKNYVYPKFLIFKEALFILSSTEVYSFLSQRSLKITT